MCEREREVFFLRRVNTGGTIRVKKNHQKISSRNKFGTSSDLEQVHNLSRFGTSY